MPRHSIARWPSVQERIDKRVGASVGQSDLLDAALRYAANGLPVFPCAPNGKVPATAHGFYDATTNAETIRQYWRVSNRNVAIPTGAFCGFWVLDIDPDGEAHIRRLEAKQGPVPPTREAITGRGGRHLWFKYTGAIKSSIGRVAPGIDVRGDDAYVVAPPSVHENGQTYRWSGDPAHEPAVAPEWLVALTRKELISERAVATVELTSGALPSGAYGRAALEDEIAALAGAVPGTRNSALNRAAFRLFQLVAGVELDEPVVVDRLVEACHANGLILDDGQRSVDATIKSGRKAGLDHPRSRSGRLV